MTACNVVVSATTLGGGNGMGGSGRISLNRFGSRLFSRRTLRKDKGKLPISDCGRSEPVGDAEA